MTVSEQARNATVIVPHTPHSCSTTFSVYDFQLFHRTKFHERHVVCRLKKSSCIGIMTNRAASVNQAPISSRASHHHCTDTHEQYCGSSTDQSRPWKTHNIARESQEQEIHHESRYSPPGSWHGGNLKVNTYLE